MKPSLLKIDSYVFKKIHLEAFDADEPKSWHVESKVAVSRRTDNSRHWLVELTVMLKGDASTSPYVGEFIVAGRFHIEDEKMSETGALDLLNVNGPSILYSAVREIVLHLTSRGPHHAVYLPSITFIDRKEPKTKQDQQKPKDSKEPAEQAKT